MALPLFLYALIVGALTMAEMRDMRRAQFVLKPLAAFGFLLIALQCGALGSLIGQIILAGLALCAVGDIALLSRTRQGFFVLGMAAFALGHLCYSAAFVVHGITFDSTGHKIVVYALAPVFAFLIYQQKAPESVLMTHAIRAYGTIISAMVILSVATGSLVWIVAAGLFAVSDLVVARDRFVTRATWHPLLITPLYFGAQALFALSVLQF